MKILEDGFFSNTVEIEKERCVLVNFLFARFISLQITCYEAHSTILKWLLDRISSTVRISCEWKKVKNGKWQREIRLILFRVYFFLLLLLLSFLRFIVIVVRWCRCRRVFFFLSLSIFDAYGLWLMRKAKLYRIGKRATHSMKEN